MAAYVDPMMAPLPQGYGQDGKDQGKDHDGQTASMQSSTELSSTVSLQTLSLLDSLDETLGGLESEHLHDRAVAARQLGKLVEGAYGEDAAAVGAYIRDSGAVEMLLELVADPVPDVHQKILMVLGNLVSDAVDHQSWRTKQVIVELQGVDYFIPHLSDADWVTQMYAAACIQNMCQNVEFASSLKGRGALQPLRNLLRSTQPAVVRFAAGALKNIGDTYALPEDGEEGQEGDKDKTPKRSLARSLSQLPKRSLTRSKPKVLQSPRVETAVKARMAEDQQRHELEVKCAILVQTRWRGIFARQDADMIREYVAAGAAITNLLRRSGKGVRILRRLASILLVQSCWRRSLAMQLVGKRRAAFEIYWKAEKREPHLISFPGESAMLITTEVRIIRDASPVKRGSGRGSSRGSSRGGSTALRDEPPRSRIAEFTRVRVLTGWDEGEISRAASRPATRERSPNREGRGSSRSPSRPATRESLGFSRPASRPVTREGVGFSLPASRPGTSGGVGFSLPASRPATREAGVGFGFPASRPASRKW